MLCACCAAWKKRAVLRLTHRSQHQVKSTRFVTICSVLCVKSSQLTLDRHAWHNSMEGVGGTLPTGQDGASTDPGSADVPSHSEPSSVRARGSSHARLHTRTAHTRMRTQTHTRVALVLHGIAWLHIAPSYCFSRGSLASCVASIRAVIAWILH